MKYLFATASAVALLAAAPAIAANNTNANDGSSQATMRAPTTQSFSQDASDAWKDTKEDVSKAATSVSNATKNAYDDIKASVIGDQSNKTVSIDSRTTAEGMIGKPIYNARNEKVATIKDIILDPNGQATMVVVSDGGVLGFGQKLATFDYNLVSQRQDNGDVIMPISDENLKKAAEFSYDAKDAGKPNVHVMPAGSLSVATLLDGQVVDPQNKTVAQVDNISFENGVAKDIIVAFDQTLGLGGKKAVLAYDDVKVLRQDNTGKNVDFQLSANQASEFENFRTSNATKTN